MNFEKLPLSQKNTAKQTLGLMGLVVSFVFVALAFWLCLFNALPLTVVWTALGFHVSYQILYWNKRVTATLRGVEISAENDK